MEVSVSKCCSMMFLGLQIVMIIMCVVYIVVPKDSFCNKVTSANIHHEKSIQCHELGTQLGYINSEVDAVENMEDLIVMWMKDRMNGGPHDTKALSCVLAEFGVSVQSKDMLLIKEFEDCSSVHYTLMVSAMWSIVLLVITSIVTMVMCIKSEVKQTDNNYWKRTKELRSNRIRNDSENTATSGLSSTQSSLNIKNPTYNSSVTVNIQQRASPGWIANLTHLLSCASPHRDVITTVQSETDLERKPHTCHFKKDVDGTLRREDLNILHETMKSVGILFTKNGGKGTVVRIGVSYVITAWHVIEDIVLPSSYRFINAVINPLLLKNPDIYTDFHECCRQSPTYMHFGFKPLIVFKDIALDIVILELDCTSKEDFLPPPISLFSDVFSLNSCRNQVPCVHIIGQHPTSETVVIDPGCKIITRDDRNVKKSRNWLKKNMGRLKKHAKAQSEDQTLIDRAYHDVYDVGSRLIFNTYLGFGGSGGAVVAILPEGGVALVAILTHGIPAYLYTTFSYPEFMKMEVGSTLKAIKESKDWEDDKAKLIIRDRLFCGDNKGQSLPEPMETEQSKLLLVDETSVPVNDVSMENITKGVQSLKIVARTTPESNTVMDIADA